MSPPWRRLRARDSERQAGEGRRRCGALATRRGARPATSGAGPPAQLRVLAAAAWAALRRGYSAASCCLAPDPGSSRGRRQEQRQPRNRQLRQRRRYALVKDSSSTHSTISRYSSGVTWRRFRVSNGPPADAAGGGRRRAGGWQVGGSVGGAAVGRQSAAWPLAPSRRTAQAQAEYYCLVDGGQAKEREEGVVGDAQQRGLRAVVQQPRALHAPVACGPGRGRGMPMPRPVFPGGATAWRRRAAPCHAVRQPCSAPTHLWRKG